jgi:putative membrane protein
MGPYDYWWHWGHGFPFFPLFPALIVMALVFCLFRIGGMKRGCGPRPMDRTDSAKDILDQRYAMGEISREQYEEMKYALKR